MKNVAKIPFVCFALFAGVYVARLFWIYTHLVAPIAIHFGPSGEANRWTDKPGFIALSALVSCVVLGLFGGLALLGPKIPDEVVNLPRKEYWLAPERREATRRKMSALFSWLGCMGVLLLGVGNESIYRTNVTGGSDAAALGFRVMLALATVMVAAALVTCWRFYRAPKRQVSEA